MQDTLSCVNRIAFLLSCPSALQSEFVLYERVHRSITVLHAACMRRDDVASGVDYPAGGLEALSRAAES